MLYWCTAVLYCTVQWLLHCRHFACRSCGHHGICRTSDYTSCSFRSSWWTCYAVVDHVISQTVILPVVLMVFCAGQFLSDCWCCIHGRWCMCITNCFTKLQCMLHYCKQFGCRHIVIIVLVNGCQTLLPCSCVFHNQQARSTQLGHFSVITNGRLWAMGWRPHVADWGMVCLTAAPGVQLFANSGNP